VNRRLQDNSRCCFSTPQAALVHLNRCLPQDFAKFFSRRSHIALCRTGDADRGYFRRAWRCDTSRLVAGLGVRGKLIVISVPDDPIQLSAFPLVFGGRSIYGPLAGTAIDNEDTLAFSVLERPSDDRDTSSRTSCRRLRSHDAGQSTLPHGAGHRLRKIATENFPRSLLDL
jgi:hypothetical protein